MRNPDTELKETIEDRDMIKVGEWQLVESEIVSWLNDTVADEKEYHPTDTVDSHVNKWLHSDGKTMMMVSEHTNDHYWARIHIHSGDDSSGGFTCGVGKHTTEDPTEAVLWAYEYMKENDDVSHLYDD